MAAVTQIRNKHSDGRAYFDRKLAEGKTRKKALRSLKRRISDAMIDRFYDPLARLVRWVRGPGGTKGV